MLQGEHSAILLPFIKLPFVIKIFVLSIFEWPLEIGFTVLYNNILQNIFDYFLIFDPLYKLRVLKRMYLHASSEGSGETAQMGRLI